MFFDEYKWRFRVHLHLSFICSLLPECQCHTMESLRRSTSPANPLNFIRIILTVKSERINLPEKFTETHGGNLLDRVTLKVPNGDAWQVDLINSNDAIWLDNGWMEFAGHYDLQFGDLLMFKYEGFSIFSVFIFNPSACEIAYPKKRLLLARSRLDSCKKVKFDELKPCLLQDRDQETEVEIYGECSSKRVKKVERKRAPEAAKGIFTEINFDIVKPCSSWDQDKAEIRIIGGCSSKRVTIVDRKRALEAAKASFKSDKPFFMVYMSPHHIAGRTSVHIPMEFVKKEWSGLKEDQKCVLKLGCRTWETNTCKHALRMVGWKIFMKDNGVAASDVCVFELLNSHENLLRVSIVKAHLLLD